MSHQTFRTNRERKDFQAYKHSKGHSSSSTGHADAKRAAREKLQPLLPPRSGQAPKGPADDVPYSTLKEKYNLSGFAYVDYVDEKCPFCQDQIGSPAYAMAGRNGGPMVHIECAINKLKEENPLSEGETISYVGSGEFAICKRLEGEEERYEIVKKLPWENNEDFQRMKAFVESKKK